jgi:hypothetical protein
MEKLSNINSQILGFLVDEPSAKLSEERAKQLKVLRRDELLRHLYSLSVQVPVGLAQEQGKLNLLHRNI